MYHKATGLEALFGYLYLGGETARLRELFSEAMTAIEEAADRPCGFSAGVRTKTRRGKERTAMNMDKTHPWKRTALDGLFYVLGSALYALSVNIFTAPNQIAPGGVTGIATLLNFVWGAPIGAMILLVNLPLLIAAWFRLGKAFTVRTLIVTILSSVVIDATAPFLPPFQGDKMLVALFGGVLAGAGLGLIYMRGATTAAPRWWPGCWNGNSAISPSGG